LKAFIVIPTYNEALNIPDLLGSILSAYPQVEVCVVDDASPDGTADVAEALAHPRVHVLRRTSDRGYGPSCSAGMEFALSRGADVVVTMDADFSHPPECLAKIFEAAQANDLVIGSRYTGTSAGVENWAFRRLVVSRLAGFYIRGMLGIPVADATSGFRCWRAGLLRKVLDRTIGAKGYAYLYETLFHAVQARARIQEVDIVYQGRTRGESKMHTGIVAEALWLPLKLRARQLSGAAH
jgi:glycosyltransferase involved in cell wall biosynthesis